MQHAMQTNHINVITAFCSNVCYQCFKHTAAQHPHSQHRPAQAVEAVVQLSLLIRRQLAFRQPLRLLGLRLLLPLLAQLCLLRQPLS
jgi:hypothetical protein